MTSTEGTDLKLTSFEVFEVPKFLPTGSGQHNWGLLEKVGRTTLGVVKEVARWGGVDRRDVGYAGLKDKRARTLQWVSSPGPLPPVGRNFRFILRTPSTKKLKPGNLMGNWFRLGLEAADPTTVVETLRRVEAGVPNFFGPQRFGRDGENHLIGRELVAGNKDKAVGMMRRRHIPLTGRLFRLMEDSYGSYLFNRLLSRRLDHPGCMEGDFLTWEGPTGPLYGKEVKLASDKPGEMEREILEEEGLKKGEFPGSGTRRALFMPLKGLSVSTGPLQVRFFLRPGTYATAVLREIVKDKKFDWPHPA